MGRKWHTSKIRSSGAGGRWPKLELKARTQTKIRTATSSPKILAKMSNGASEGNAAAMETEKAAGSSTILTRLRVQRLVGCANRGQRNGGSTLIYGRGSAVEYTELVLETRPGNLSGELCLEPIFHLGLHKIGSFRSFDH